jgi:hypothetical protein
MGYLIVRFDDDGTTPAPPSGKYNVKFQGATSNNDVTQLNVSAYVDSVADADVVFADVTTGNVSSSKHGYAPKNPGDATKYLDGTGAYSVPGAGGGGGISMTGINHGFWFNNSTSFDASNTKPSNGGSSFWSKQGGTQTVFNSTSIGGKPAYYKLAVSSANGSIAEDSASGAQGCWNIFRGYSAFVGLDDNNSGQVCWLAMSSVLYGSIGANANPNGTLFGFRYVQGTDTHWQAYVGTGTGTFTIVDTGVTPDTAFHRFEFYRNATGGIDFYIDGSKVATIASSATGFPGNNTGCYCVMNINSASSTTAIDFAGIQWWSE